MPSIMVKVGSRSIVRRGVFTACEFPGLDGLFGKLSVELSRGERRSSSPGVDAGRIDEGSNTSVVIISLSLCFLPLLAPGCNEVTLSKNSNKMSMLLGFT